MPDSKILVTVFITALLGKVCDAGSLTLDRIKTNFGGGECIDSEDCNNFGVCKILPKSKGRCRCVFGYYGQHCAAKLKETVGSVVDTNEKKQVTQRQPSITGGKRGDVLLSDSKQKLDYEPSSNIFGLTPHALAEAGQPFVIFSPEKRVYVFVSHDLRAVGKSDPYVEARVDKFGSRNIFKFIKVSGAKNEFYIHNLDQNKYLYVSESSKGAMETWDMNLLASSVIPSNEEEKEKFLFEFEDEDEDGLFTISNRNRILYVSNHLAGNPPSNLVKVASKEKLRRLDSKYFQFALRDKVFNIEFKVVGGKIPSSDPITLVDGTQSRKVCYKGLPGDVEKQATNIEFVEEFTDRRSYTKAEGFLFNTAMTEFKDLYGAEQFIHTSSEAEIIRKSVTKSVIININMNKCACVRITLKNMQYKQPYEFRVKSKENKALKSQGFIQGEREFDFQVHTEMFDYREFFKCPHEA